MWRLLPLAGAAARWQDRRRARRPHRLGPAPGARVRRGAGGDGARGAGRRGHPAPAGRYGPGYPGALHDAAPDGDLLFVRSGARLGAILGAYAPDLALCASFPARIPDDALAAPRHGILNAHPALLPRYRGPNPLGWALRNDDGVLGMTLHRMTREFDAGPVYAQAAVPVADDEDPAADGSSGSRASRRSCWPGRWSGSRPATRATPRTRRRPPTRASSSRSTSRSTGPARHARCTTRRGPGSCRRPWAAAAGRSPSSTAAACGSCARACAATTAGGRWPAGDGPIWVLESEPVAARD